MKGDTVLQHNFRALIQLTLRLLKNVENTFFNVDFYMTVKRKNIDGLLPSS